LTQSVNRLRSPSFEPAKTVGSQTALIDSINAGSMLRTPSLGDVIYVITDGSDNHSKENFDKVANALSSDGVRLFSVVVLPDRNPSGVRTVRVTPGPEYSLEQITRMTEATGGWTASLEAPQAFAGSQLSARLRKNLGVIYSLMLNFYRLDIELPTTITEPQDWALEIGIDQSTAKNLLIAKPSKLMPCK
jgi:hypothetical protein